MTVGRRRLLLPFAYMGTVLLLSSVRGGDVKSLAGIIFQWITPAWQNLLHIPLYGGLAAAWLWALFPSPIGFTTRLVTAFALTLGWGALDELYQSTVPGRYSSITDLSLNAIGAALAVLYASLQHHQTLGAGSDRDGLH